MHIDLSDKRALVTGASSGIGAAIAEAYAAAGARVAVHARTLEKAGPTLERIQASGGRAFAVAADLEDSAAIAAMCAAALDGLGGIDIVMNNAGIAAGGRVADMDEVTWDRVMRVNLKAPFLIAKLTVAAMIAQGRGGRQLFISSTGAKIAEAEASAYNASKAGMNAFVRCFAAEVGAQGITVNAICPDWVDTPMARRDFERSLAAGESFEEVYERGMRDNMQHTMIEPVDVANLAVYLASDQARRITGQAINVCAGACASL